MAVSENGGFLVVWQAGYTRQTEFLTNFKIITGYPQLCSMSKDVVHYENLSKIKQIDNE